MCGTGEFPGLAAAAGHPASNEESGVVLVKALGTVLARRLPGQVLVFPWTALPAGGGGGGRLEKAGRARLARCGAVGGLVGPGRAGCAGTGVDARVASVARIADAGVGAHAAVAVGRAGGAGRGLVGRIGVVGVVVRPRYVKAGVAGVAARGGDVVVVDNCNGGD